MGSKNLIANRNARSYVALQQPFQGSNLYGQRESNGLYAVYSYGPHFPLFVFDSRSGVWYENEDRYSPTTSKHRGQVHPHVDTTKLSTTAIKCLIATGNLPEGS